jgi:phosphoglycerate kinase
MLNSPPGVFEFDAFANGSRAMFAAIAQATQNGSTTILGGGDTASAAKKFNYAQSVTHVSTGGGASLELLEGKQLPGIVFLSDRSDVAAPTIRSRL